MQRDILSVSELTRRIKFQLESGFSSLLIEGEISNLVKARSGHWYFTLKDSFSQISCVMFKGQNQYLRLSPQDGTKVLMRGRINVYEPRGNYQFIADSMEDRGSGILMQRFEALKQKLDEEGLFDEDHKKELPFLPQRIAVVTSPEGAAVRDVLRVIKRRFARMSVVIVPTLVQGDKAPAGIVEALKKAEQLSNVDLIILTRGGGSMEDLWAFNDEKVARAVFKCSIPVISAVGHEVDFTIADFVADKRAATPSQAAEIAVPVLDELYEELSGLFHRLTRSVNHIIVEKKLELGSLAKNLKSPRDRVQDSRLHLDNLSHRLITGFPREVESNRRVFFSLQKRLSKQNPQIRLHKKSMQFKLLTVSLCDSMSMKLDKKQTEFAKQVIRLDSLSPLAVLSRGYSMIMDEDRKVIRDAKNVKTGDNIFAYLQKGYLIAEVKETGDKV